VYAIDCQRMRERLVTAPTAAAVCPGGRLKSSAAWPVTRRRSAGILVMTWGRRA